MNYIGIFPFRIQYIIYFRLSFHIAISHMRRILSETPCAMALSENWVLCQQALQTHINPPPLPVNECRVISLVEDCLSIVWSETQASSYIHCQNLLLCHKWCYAYQWILWAPIADSQGSWFFQQVEILLLELETLHAAFKADTSCQMWTNAVGQQCQTNCS